jgi:small subunit ribosomal protein S17
MRTKQGTITAMKMTGTVTVTVHSQKVHPKYKKSFRVSKKFLADTNGMDLGVGDIVLMTETRPMSKRKYFKVTDVVKQAPRVSEMAEEAALQAVTHHKKKKEEDSDSKQDT